MLRALSERCRSVPAQVSVVGFDDLPDASPYQPSLTTVHQDFAAVGQHCVQTLLRQIRDLAAQVCLDRRVTMA